MRALGDDVRLLGLDIVARDLRVVGEFGLALLDHVLHALRGGGFLHHFRHAQHADHGDRRGGFLGQSRQLRDRRHLRLRRLRLREPGHGAGASVGRAARAPDARPAA